MKQSSIYLSLIVVFAALLRIPGLNITPISLFGDEVDVGYQAFSILATSKDYLGNFLPVYFQSFAEYRIPLFLYSAVPTIAIFGLNEWGVRLPAAIFGIASIPIFYLFVKKLFQSKALSLVASFLLATSPWHIQYSRAGFEVTLLLFLILLGVYFLFLGLENPRFFILSAIFTSLSFYSYSTATIFLPLLLIGIVLIYRQELLNKRFLNLKLLSLVIFVLILTPMVAEIFFGHAAARFGIISIFANSEIIQEINLKRQEPEITGKPDVAESFFHNKLASAIFFFAKNYFWSFSPQFLFFDGDPVLTHHVGDMGMLFWALVPLLILGLFVYAASLKEKNTRFLFFWLLAGPAAASLTQNGGFHATRLFIQLVPLMIFSAKGAQSLLLAKEKLNRIVILFIAVIFVFNFVFYLHRYWIHYAPETWRWWHQGYKEAFEEIARIEENFDKVFINNTYEPALIRFLFYTKYDPAKLHQKFTGDKPKKQILPGFDGFSLENKYFFGVKTSDFSKILDSKTLYLASQRDEVPGDLDYRKEPPANVKVLKTITNPFGQPIFYLLTGMR